MYKIIIRPLWLSSCITIIESISLFFICVYLVSFSVGCVFRGSTEQLASKLHPEASGSGDKQLQRHLHIGSDNRHPEMTWMKWPFFSSLSCHLIMNKVPDFNPMLGTCWVDIFVVRTEQKRHWSSQSSCKMGHQYKCQFWRRNKRFLCLILDQVPQTHLCVWSLCVCDPDKVRLTSKTCK